jgi:hypothetical protein
VDDSETLMSFPAIEGLEGEGITAVGGDVASVAGRAGKKKEEENHHEEEDCQAKGWRKTVTMKEEDCPTEPEHALD